MADKSLTRNVLPRPIKAVERDLQQQGDRLILNDIRGVIADKLITKVFREGTHRVIPQPGYDRLKIDQDNLLSHINLYYTIILKNI